MCGIAGLISSVMPTGLAHATVQAMTDAQQHRGPDDDGLDIIHPVAPAVVFGHRRLAIIDLSPAGHQPMHDPETGNWITFNGEIYNFQELRRVLETKGCRFRTQSDTEVILKAYAVWGTDCVARLRGIFAFGLWDARAARLLLTRDQLGVKPLYYWRDTKQLLFASEVRALLASGVVARRLDPRGLRAFLAYGALQDPLTLVDQVQSLLPGHWMTWQEGHVEVERYWHLPEPACVLSEPPADVFERIADLVSDAVRMQLVSDVPIGAFLSGGIDSTAIAALMARVSTSVVKTFCVVFDRKEYDEREYAQIAARRAGTDHTELPLVGEDVRRELPRALASFDQPSVDGLNTYFVSKVTREAGLTVALSGLGGDELFGGYSGYRRSLLAEKWGQRIRKIPKVMYPAVARGLRYLPNNEATLRTADALESQWHPYFLTRQLFSPVQVSHLLKPDLIDASQDWEPARFSQLQAETGEYDSINRSSALEMQTYMLSMLLRDADQMSMSHALEVRVPLIDHKLVEYIFTLPGKCKVDPSLPKPLLTRALGSALPDECVQRPKRGFDLPFEIWLRESLAEQIHFGIVQSNEKSDLFRVSGLESIWEQFQQGKLRWSRPWSILVLTDWLARHAVRFEG